VAEHRVKVGRVVAFDEHAGLGQVETAAGQRFDFHCTALTDGSRHIGTGEPVVFRVGPGGPGRWEAHEVTRTG
jgi:cold shock CspA family protein